MDAVANFSYSTVATAPSPASSGTSLVVAAGHGTRFPAVPFNAVIWPFGAIPTPLNAEIVRMTALATDTFTMTRTQESTSARTVVVGDQIAACITSKLITDLNSRGAWTPALSPVSGSGIAYSANTLGRYVKMGPLVWVTFSIELTSLGTASGNLTLTGLPFTVRNFGGSYLNDGGFVAFTVGTAQIGIQIFPIANGTTATIACWAAATTNSFGNALTAAILGATGSLRGQICYETDQ